MMKFNITTYAAGRGKKRAVKELASRYGCLHCQSKQNMTWHHVDPKTKTKTVARLISQDVSWPRIAEEVKKCIPLCETCHTEIHQNTSILYLIKFKIKCFINYHICNIRPYIQFYQEQIQPILLRTFS